MRLAADTLPRTDSNSSNNQRNPNNGCPFQRTLAKVQTGAFLSGFNHSLTFRQQFTHSS
jgi:hypothetical protein